jgi:hypothetical protein
VNWGEGDGGAGGVRGGGEVEGESQRMQVRNSITMISLNNLEEEREGKGRGDYSRVYQLTLRCVRVVLGGQGLYYVGCGLSWGEVGVVAACQMGRVEGEKKGGVEWSMRVFVSGVCKGLVYLGLYMLLELICLHVLFLQLSRLSVSQSLRQALQILHVTSHPHHLLESPRPGGSNSSLPSPPTRVPRPLSQRPLHTADKRIHDSLETQFVTHCYCERSSKAFHRGAVVQRRTADDPSAHLRSDEVLDVRGRRSGAGEAECAG